MNGAIHFPKPINAPMVNFEPGSMDASTLKETLAQLRNAAPKMLPLWIGGKPIQTHERGVCRPPHDLGRTMAYYAIAMPQYVESAIEHTLAAKHQWEKIPWHMRLHIFRKAAYLLQHQYFIEAVAVTMEDFSKNPYEAMIDVIELIDFLNFNVYWASEIYQKQPTSSAVDFNFVDYRPWEGFITAIAPNNFISIALNLCCAPLIMGNVVIAKLAPETIFSFHFMLNILHEAGLPKDVLAVLHGDEKMIGNIFLTHPYLSHMHFTGSIETMHKLIEIVWKNIKGYIGFPRVIGEAGGKNFMIVYDDADPEEVVNAIIPSAFGYQGRKCSALSRLYLTCEMWARIETPLIETMKQIRVGDVADFRNYMGAIISEQEYQKIHQCIYKASNNPQTEKIIGGLCVIDVSKKQKGFYVYPTVIVTKHSKSPTMLHEIFGPVLTVYPMDRAEFQTDALALCGDNAYRLTGAIQTSDVSTFWQATDELRYAAGNLYDCRTTGAIVARQPFGGSGKSGSNSKPGSDLNLYAWINPRCVSLSHQKPRHFIPAYLEY